MSELGSDGPDASSGRLVRYDLVPARSSIAIEARSSIGPIHWKATAAKAWVDAEVAGGKVHLDRPLTASLELRMVDLTSGNSLYDAELQRRLDVRRFPTARIELRAITALDTSDRFQVSADVSVHNTTRSIAGTVTLSSPDERRIVVEGEHVFDIRDFGISAPAVLMLRIFPDVRIRLRLEVEQHGTASEGVRAPAVVGDRPAVAESILERSDDAIFTVDRDRRIVRWNRGAARLYGHAEPDVVGTACTSLFPDHLRAQADELLTDLLAGATVERVASEGCRRDGLLFPIQISAVPDLDGHGRVESIAVIARDVTEQRLAQAALAEKEERLREAQSLARVGRWLWDLASSTVQWSDELYRMHGVRPLDFDGTLAGYLELVSPEHRAEVSATLQRSLSSKHAFDLEYEIVRPDDGTCWVRNRAEPVRDSAGQVLGFEGTCQDLTERRATERAGLMELLRQFTVAANEAPAFEEALSGCLQSVCTYFGACVGEAYLASSSGEFLVSAGIFHEQGESLVGRVPMSRAASLARGRGIVGRVFEAGVPAWETDLDAALGAERAETAVAAGIRAAVAVPVLVGQEVVAVLEFLLPMAEQPDDDLLEVLANGGTQLGRVVERQRAELAIAHQALHDPLTMLANRTLLMDRLSQALARLQRDSQRLAVLFLDLDDFRMINESLGHEVGDGLLVAVSDRLRALAREGDTVARFGGDKFVIVCDELSGEEVVVNIAERVGRAVAEPIGLDHSGDHHEVTVVTASIGIALAEGSWVRPEVLLRDADLAMSRAKEAGRGSCQIFDPGMHLRATDRLVLTNDLRLAADHGELRLVYQPQVSVDGGEVVGVEALVRWQHPERGLLPPSEFIDLAERSELIVPVGSWVIREACRQAAEWRRQQVGSDTLKMCINVSARQLAHPDLLPLVRTVLDDTCLDPASMCVEITESVLVGNVDSLLSLEALKALGVTLAVDDFGTGYSSLAYIQRFPIDVLKIDKGFIDGLGRSNERSRSVVGAVVDLAHAMGHVAVAEGVEEAAQLDDLVALGCDVVQGYYFARPSEPDVVAWHLSNPTWGDHATPSLGRGAR